MRLCLHFRWFQAVSSLCHQLATGWMQFRLRQALRPSRRRMLLRSGLIQEPTKTIASRRFSGRR